MGVCLFCMAAYHCSFPRPSRRRINGSHHGVSVLRESLHVSNVRDRRSTTFRLQNAGHQILKLMRRISIYGERRPFESKSQKSLVVRDFVSSNGKRPITCRTSERTVSFTDVHFRQWRTSSKFSLGAS